VDERSWLEKPLRCYEGGFVGLAEAEVEAFFKKRLMFLLDLMKKEHRAANAVAHKLAPLQRIEVEWFAGKLLQLKF
jgi:hypothetical protein